MQHGLYHVYTVDEHILMVIRNLRRVSMSRSMRTVSTVLAPDRRLRAPGGAASRALPRHRGRAAVAITAPRGIDAQVLPPARAR
jgi:hypothetical protein